MTWMAGYILPVRLLGYTRTGRMAPESPTVRLNWTRWAKLPLVVRGPSSLPRAC
jgi:hypothetical protein